MFGPNPTGLRKQRTPEIMQRFDPGPMREAAPAAVEAPPLNMLQVMSSGAAKQSPMDDPWRRALFAAGASMLDSGGRSVGSALGRGIGVGLNTYDTQRQLQAQAGIKDRETRVEEALAQAKMAEMNGERAKQARMEKARAGLLEEFQLTADMSPEQRQVTLSNLMMKALSIGDTGVAGAISQAIQSVGAGKAGVAPALKEVDFGNTIGMVNPVTGEVVKRYPKGLTPQAPGSGGIGRDGKPTEGQLVAAGIRPRMVAANAALEGLDTELTARFAGSSLPGNFIATPEGQRAKVLGEAFLMGILRVESKSAITDNEMKQYTAIYLPQPGDAPGTLALKAQLRNEALNQMLIQSGPAKSEAPAASFTGGARPAVPAAIADANKRYPKPGQ